MTIVIINEIVFYFYCVGIDILTFLFIVRLFYIILLLDCEKTYFYFHIILNYSWNFLVRYIFTFLSFI